MPITLTCENKESIPTEHLLKQCFGVDASGKTFLRTVKVDVTTGGNNNDAYDCNLAEVMNLELLLRKAVVLDGDGKAALYIGESSF